MGVRVSLDLPNMKLTAEQLKRKEYYLKHKDRIKAYNKEYRKTYKRTYNPELEKKQKLRSNYGLPWEQYLALYNQQQGLCKICFKFLTLDSSVKTEKPYVDHCHTTGKVRGLLCNKCNFGLGHFDDDTNKLQNAIRYLNEA